MVGPVQKAVQGRYGPKSSVPVEEIASLPWQPRADGKHAVLVTPRRTVFDRTVETVAVEAATAPIGEVPSCWTHDLVFARLRSIDAIARRLPRPQVPAVYRSFLGELQPQDAVPGRAKPLTAEEAARFDWTMARLYAWPEIDRAILMGVMAGRSFDLVVKVTRTLAARIGGKPMARSSVHRRFHGLTKTMAVEWNGAGVLIDAATRECWLAMAQKIFRRRWTGGTDFD